MNGLEPESGPVLYPEFHAADLVLIGTDLQEDRPPVFILQPQNQMAAPGDSVTFTTAVLGTGSIAYQWYFNETNLLAQATGPGLTLSPVLATDTGTLRAVASNAYGSVTSLVATLAVPLCTNLPPGLAGWWPGDIHAVDVVGFHNATLFNGADYGLGIVNQAFDLDGVDDYIAIPNAPEWALTSSFTWEMWIYPRSLANSPGLFEKALTVGNRVGLQVTADGQLGGFFDSGFYSAVSAPGTVATGQFSHVAFVFDDAADQARIYVNGNLAGTGSETRRPQGNSEDLVLGKSSTFDGYNFDGLIDEFSLYNRALSDQEIRAAFLARAEGKCGSYAVPILLQPPAGQAVAAGENAFFSVVAQSVPAPTFQWRRNGVPLADATNDTLALSQVQPANAGAYTVVVENPVGRITSPAATLTVLTPPLIAGQPQSQITTPGSLVVMSVNALGSEPLSYQWSRDGIALPGETRFNLVLNGVTVLDSGTFTVEVSNVLGTVTSEPASLLVLVPPEILVPPFGTNVNLGDPAAFCVSVSGSDPLRYQWRKNGVNIPGATNQCYSLEAVNIEDGGTYAVVVANDVGTFTSDPARLVVNVIQVPAGDDFEGRVLLEENILRGSNTGATKQPGEPDHAGQPGGRSVWYTRQAAVDGIATVRTSGSSFDTLLAVYRGDSLETLEPVASDEDDGGFFSSEVRFNVRAGEFFQIAVDGFDGASGDFALTWEVEPTEDSLPEIEAPPASRTVVAGSEATFSVAANQPSSLYQWFFEGQPIPGATQSSLTLAEVGREHVGAYTVRITNLFQRWLESAPAILEIGPVAGGQSQDKISNPTLSGHLDNPAWVGAGASISSKSQGNSSSLTSGGGILVGAGTLGSQIMNNTHSLAQAGEPNHCGALGGSTRWLIVNAGSDGFDFSVDTLGSAIPTILAVYTRNNVLEPLSEVACDKSTGQVASVTFPASIGRDYWIAVDGWNGAQGIIQLNWRLGRVPPATAAEANLTTPVDGGVVLSATSADAFPPPSWQWLFEGTPIPGATNRLLNLGTVLPENAGRYAVVASNLMGLAIQHVANLQVDGRFQAVVRTDFDSDPEDWAILSEGQLLPPRSSVTGGSSGGYVEYSDDQNPGVWYWVAPSKYLGNQSAAYGGTLQFDQFNSGTGQPLEAPDIILVGDGRTLIYERSAAPGTNWTTSAVPLEASAEWHVGDATGPAPTRSELAGALGSVEQWLIRGAFGAESNRGGLDRVSLIAPMETEVALLRVEDSSGGQVVLEWPESAAAFQLESASTLPFNWTPVTLFPQSVNGFRRITMTRPAAGRFFRLRKR
jgi:Concanavalin A-like lectin/glucanases superfamily/Laminin B (Domain IV)/Immunoglobulin I-set domain/Immunoglobulin domain